MIAVLACLLCCTQVFAQSGASLCIRVHARDGACPMVSIALRPGKEVKLIQGERSVEFSGLQPGSYHLELNADGYGPVDTSVTLLMGEFKSLVLPLHPIVVLDEYSIEHEARIDNVRRYTQQEIKGSTFHTLPEFLKSVAGIDVVEDGTAGGSSTIRIGGSRAEHVTVYVDGRRIQHIGTGEGDLTSIPLNWVEFVEVSRGTSPEFNGESIGGVLRIHTRRGERPESLISTEIRPTFARTGILRSGSFGRMQSMISLEHTQGKGNYRYRISEDDGNGVFTPDLGEVFHRNNADINRDQILGKVRTRLFDSGTLEFIGTLDRAVRGMPGYLAPQLTPLARQSSHQETATAKLNHKWHKVDFEHIAAYQHDWRRYTNTDPFSYVSSSQESGNQWQLDSRGSLQKRSWMLSAGGSWNHDDLRTLSVRDGKASRSRIGTWIRLRKDLWTNDRIGGKVAFSPAVRYEASDDTDIVLPSGTISFELDRGTRFGAQVTCGRSYHAPTLYSLFWLDDQVTQGNPELKPEVSRDIIGSCYLELPSCTRLEFSISDQEIMDLIYWKRTFDNRWKPFNLKNAHIKTLDIFANQSLWKNRLKLSGSLNWTEARDATDDRNTGGKYLTFRAPRSQRASVEIVERGWKIMTRMNWVSSRPVLETNSKWLASYRLMDASISCRFRIKRVEVEPLFGVENILDENYRIIRFAPMPLRQWIASIRITGE